MKAIAITKENYTDEILKSNKPVLLDFWAAWCGPCKILAPILDEIARELPDIKLCKVNSDEQPEIAQTFHISSVPNLFLLKNGEVVKQTIGLVPKAAILDMISSCEPRQLMV